MNKKTFFFTKSKQVMGILNVTPDSFSDGGRYKSLDNALAQAEMLIQHGADCIDIGGQSTRPGYEEVNEVEECQRILPVIKKLREKSNIPISVDTYFPTVAREALKYGADIINDVKGLDTPGMMEVIKEMQCGVIIMHSRERRTHLSLKEDIHQFYQEKIQTCRENDIPLSSICLDPGIGFNKSTEENGEILKNPATFKLPSLPALIGSSRKRIIGTICQETNPLARDTGSVVAALHALQEGIEVVRVHNVKEMKDAIKMWNFITSH